MLGGKEVEEKIKNKKKRTAVTQLSIHSTVILCS